MVACVKTQEDTCYVLNKFRETHYVIKKKKNNRGTHIFDCLCA